LNFPEGAVTSSSFSSLYDISLLRMAEPLSVVLWTREGISAAGDENGMQVTSQSLTNIPLNKTMI
jgi:hypothetical protein